MRLCCLGRYATTRLGAGSRSLLLAARPDLLRGLVETDDLEAKKAAYRLNDPKSQFELAKDVAAFANGEGGLIALGLATERLRRAT